MNKKKKIKELMIFFLKKKKKRWLSLNNLNGTIPESFGNLTNLTKQQTVNILML